MARTLALLVESIAKTGELFLGQRAGPVLDRRDDPVHDGERGPKLVRREGEEVALQLAEAPSVLLLARGLEEDASDCADSG